MHDLVYFLHHKDVTPALTKCCHPTSATKLSENSSHNSSRPTLMVVENTERPRKLIGMIL